MLQTVYFITVAQRVKTDSASSSSIEVEGEAESYATLHDRYQSLCIICNQGKFKNDSKLFRLCEKSRAETFLKAISFNLDDVYTRCSTYDSVNNFLLPT